MLAVWCLVVPVVSIYLVGLPIRGLLARGKPLDEEAWIHVPFIGVAVTVLLLQFQVYLDIPVNRGVLALWVLVLALWLIWLRRGVIRASFRSTPIAVFAIGVAVASVHSLGLFLRGCDDYVGRAWSDQANYTAMAECFRTVGYSFDVEDNYSSAWLGRVARLKTFRIGQSVLQAYHGVITRSPTRMQFMPTVFLCFPMISLAAFASCRRLQLSRVAALIAAFFAGLVPGLAMLGLECFQSHVWGIPFLLMLPPLLSVYGTDRDIGSLGTAFLCLGALTSIYTEFIVFELALVAGFFVLAIAQRPRRLGHCLGYVVLFAAPWLCNPLYESMNVFLTSATLRQPLVLQHIYPWAYDELELGIIWSGDSTDYAVSEANQTAAIVSGHAVVWGGLLGLNVLAVLGLLRWWRGDRCVWPKGFDLVLALLALAMIPSAMQARDQDHPYQYFKLLLTVSPIYAIGVVALGSAASRLATVYMSRMRVPCVVAMITIWCGVVVLAAVATAGTGRMALRSARFGPMARSRQHVALNSEFRALRDQLEAIRDQDILLQPPYKERVYHQIWSMYYARHNRLWLTWPQHNDAHSFEVVKLTHLHDFATLPKCFLVLCSPGESLMLPPSGAEIVWQSPSYLLWKYDGRPWACIYDAVNPNGEEQLIREGVWLGGGETTFRMFASEAGVGKFRVHMHRGPCVDSTDKLRVRIKGDNGTSQIVVVEEGDITFDFDLKRGNNSVSIEVLNPQRGSAAGDPRPLLARLLIRELSLEPQAKTASPTDVNPRN